MNNVNSYVVRKDRCPKCSLLGKDRKGDNLAVYNDGHSWCFACGYYIPGDFSTRIRAALDPKVMEHLESIALPEDIVPATSGEGSYWLYQYGITIPEILVNRIYWSESSKLLIFPVIIDRDIVAWQGRNFNPSKKYKYLTKGNTHDNYMVRGDRSKDTLVLVEDNVSAIKVARHLPCLGVMGSVISSSRFLRLKRSYPKMIIWLDPDKASESIKYANLGRQLGIECRTILSDKDPKEHTNEEIKELLK